jgi:hypothetical protein
VVEKKEKTAVDYTPVAAMKDERCDKCQHFRPMYEACNLVKGHIKPGAWCKLWRGKT